MFDYLLEVMNKSATLTQDISKIRSLVYPNANPDIWNRTNSGGHIDGREENKLRNINNLENLILKKS